MTRKIVPERIEVIYHYSKEDPDCDGDYYDVEIFFDEVLVQTYGDYYHDKGSIKVEAWLEGYFAALGITNYESRVETKDIADRDD